MQRDISELAHDLKELKQKAVGFPEIEATLDALIDRAEKELNGGVSQWHSNPQHADRSLAASPYLA